MAEDAHRSRARRRAAARRLGTALAGAAALLASAALVSAHGDMAPQPVDTAGLPELGDEMLTENPYRGLDEAVWSRAIEIGDSGYNQNCARCHGLGAVSGGLAPDLRHLEAEEYGDEWYMDRFVHGYTQGGVTRMPAFGEILSQEAAWAIRTYIETRPDDRAIAEATPELQAIRDALAAAAEGGDLDEEAVRARLAEIASGIDTLSGAPEADSIAHRAARQIAGTPASYAMAAETLTVGLSAAR